MSIGDSVQLRVCGRYQDQNIVNTLWYEITAQDPPNHAVLESLCSAWLAAYAQDWVDVHSDTYQLIGLKAFGSADSDLPVPGIVFFPGSGGVSGADLPASFCRTMTIYTDSSNHRRRGRIMLSGTIAEWVDPSDGSIEDQHLTDMATLANNLVDLSPLSANGNEFKFVVHSPDEMLSNEDAVFVSPRKTPASIRTRRVREMSIG